ncbi:MAG: bifunctional folylpolyglutamate synthase/dihydrofolate synthase [Ruminococcus sp.]|nr:bifunctional folylpolyglutamate synthase/dihydrofolate synthase [Ruminococcus sp.]
MNQISSAEELLEKAKAQGSILGLERIKALLKEMGDPQDKLRTVHISGTNGKGSFSAMLGKVLCKAGYTVGSFSSPAITSVTDQFRINGEEIKYEELCGILCDIAPVWESLAEKPTEFEVLTAAAFELFIRRKCNIVLVECGMGGDLDSTNVIASPLLSVITNVQRDHMGFLGNTTAEIASHKAGIIKQGRPVLFGGSVDQDACHVIGMTAKKMSSELFCTDYSRLGGIHSDLSGTSFSFTGFGSLKIPLIGEYQPYNAANVLTAVEILRNNGVDIPDNAIRAGLASVKWHGRFEVLRQEPLVIFDGSHNPDGIRSAAKTIAELFPDTKPALLIGVMADKEYQLYADILGSLIDCVFTVKPDNPRSLSSEILAETFTEKGISAKPFTVLTDGVSEALSYVKKKRIPLIALGSLYMYREFTAALDTLK